VGSGSHRQRLTSPPGLRRFLLADRMGASLGAADPL